MVYQYFSQPLYNGNVITFHVIVLKISRSFSLLYIVHVFIFIRSSGKFLSFYKEIMDAQHFSFYIIL